MTKLTLILALNDPHDARVSLYYSYSNITPLAKIPRTNTLKVMSLTCNSVQYFQPMNTLANFSSSSQPASPDHPSVSPFLDPVHITPHVLQPSHIHTGPGLLNDLPPEFRPFPLPSPSLPITSYHLLYIHVISITIGLSTRNQSAMFSKTHTLGAVHKVRHARGEQGVREGVTFCNRGRGKEDVTSHL